MTKELDNIIKQQGRYIEALESMITAQQEDREILQLKLDELDSCIENLQNDFEDLLNTY